MSFRFRIELGDALVKGPLTSISQPLKWDLLEGLLQLLWRLLLRNGEEQFGVAYPPMLPLFGTKLLFCCVLYQGFVRIRGLWRGDGAGEILTENEFSYN